MKGVAKPCYYVFVQNSLCIVCRVAQLEDLTFKQQMAVYAESQVVIMTHGAALGNVLFMSPVSSLLLLLYHTR